jgi:hypothetical protein
MSRAHRMPAPTTTVPMLLICLCGALAVAPATAADEMPAIASLQWLTGTWARAVTGGGTARETWHTGGEGVLRGRAVVHAGDGTQQRLIETMLIVQMDNDVFYIAKPAENLLPVSFKLVSTSPACAGFENPAYDFPSRFEYCLQSDGRLRVVGSGRDEGSFTLLFERE